MAQYRTAVIACEGLDMRLGACGNRLGGLRPHQLGKADMRHRAHGAGLIQRVAQGIAVHDLQRPA